MKRNASQKRPASAGKIAFRPTTPRDAVALRELVRKYYAFDHIPFNARAIQSGLKKLLKDPLLGRAWFIMAGREIAGYAVLTFGFDYEFGGRTGLITDLYLEPQFRGLGLGRRTLRHLEAYCQKSGLAALELQVESSNRRAVRLYRSFGFEPFGRIPMSKRVKS